jgi:hypothetical protein
MRIYEEQFNNFTIRALSRSIIMNQIDKIYVNAWCIEPGGMQALMRGVPAIPLLTCVRIHLLQSTIAEMVINSPLMQITGSLSFSYFSSVLPAFCTPLFFFFFPFTKTSMLTIPTATTTAAAEGTAMYR